MSANRHSKLAPYVFDPDYMPPAEKQFYRDFLSEGDLAVWVGREKHRKTNVCLQFAISAALGRSFLRFAYLAAQPAKVVIIDYESKPLSLKRRYEALSASMKLSPEDRSRLKQNLEIIQVREMLKQGANFPRLPVENGNHKPVGAEKAKSPAQLFWDELVRQHPADIYIADPLRCLHAMDENDSSIETLLAAIRKTFKSASVVVLHHMRKQSRKDDANLLKNDMRAWSDDARGSTAIKAHADVIICQERIMESNGDEIVYWGAFLKDAADIEPISLRESDAQSFFWEVSPEVPKHLAVTHTLLTNPGRFADKASMVKLLTDSNMKRATAYRHIAELEDAGMLTQAGSTWVVGGEVALESFMP